MVKGIRRPLPEKSRAGLTLIILLILSLCGYAQYNPSQHVIVNDAVSKAQATPLDGTTMFFDPVFFAWRPFQSTSEVLSTLNLSKYRFGNSIIVVDSGGTLTGGAFINGTNTFYMFRNGTADSNLVKMNLFATSGCSGCLLAANNLSDLANAGVARTNLGLGGMAVLGVTAGGDLSGFYPNPTVSQFNGLPPSYYLSYGNLTGKPTIPAQFNPIQGANMAITGTYPNITFSSTGGGSGCLNCNADSIAGLPVLLSPIRNGYVLTLDSANGRFYLAPPDTASSGGGTGLNQLTQDVLAGPGTGSQAATVVGIRGVGVPTLASGYLFYNGVSFNWGNPAVNWTLAGNYLYPNSITDTVVIGGTSGAGGGLLTVNGNIYVGGSAFSYFNAPVQIGGGSYASSSILDLNSTTKAFLLPRMNTTQQNAISGPVAGELIYNTDSSGLTIYSTAWNKVSGNCPTCYSSMTAIGDSAISWNRSNGTRDTVVFPTSLPSLTLSNNGSGFRLVEPLSGGNYPIQTLVAGTNVTLDSTSHSGSLTINATGGGGGGLGPLTGDVTASGTGSQPDTVKKIQSIPWDTSGTGAGRFYPVAYNYLTKTYKQKPVEEQVGIIYNKNSWTSGTLASDFTTNGATVAVTANKLAFSGGAGTYTQTLDIKGPWSLDHWEIFAKVLVAVTSGGSSFGVGTRSINAQGGYHSVVGRTLTNTAGTNGNVYLDNVDVSTTTNLSTAANQYTATNGGYVTISVKRDLGSITVSVRDYTNNTLYYTNTYAYTDQGTSTFLPNAGTFSIYSFGGTFTVDSLVVKSTSVKNANVLSIGDSKTVGYEASTFPNSWAYQIGTKYGPTSIWAGGSDASTDIISEFAQLKQLTPRQVLLSTFSNDTREGVLTPAQSDSNFVQIYDSLTSWGNDVYILEPFAENASGGGIDLTFQKTFVTSGRFPLNKVIDTWTPMTWAGSIYTDGIHPTDIGHSRIFGSIVGSNALSQYSNVNEFASPIGGSAPYIPVFNGSSLTNSFLTSQTVSTIPVVQDAGQFWITGASGSLLWESRADNTQTFAIASINHELTFENAQTNRVPMTFEPAGSLASVFIGNGLGTANWPLVVSTDGAGRGFMVLDNAVNPGGSSPSIASDAMVINTVSTYGSLSAFSNANTGTGHLLSLQGTSGNVAIGSTSDNGLAILQVNGKESLATADSVATPTGGCVFRDAITGLLKITPCGSGGGSDTVNVKRGIGTTSGNTIVLGTQVGTHFDSSVYMSLGNTVASLNAKFTFDSVGTGMIFKGVQTGFGATSIFVHMPDSSFAELAIGSGLSIVAGALTASGSGGVTTVGTFSGSSIANGASISGATITFGPADVTNPGMVTTGAQTFAGIKTLTSKLIIGNTFSTNGASLSMIGNTSASANSGNYGTYFSAINGLTNTDPGGAGTYSTFTGAYLGAPTFAATNAITYTTAATLWVNGSPSASTNVTIGTAYALYVASGTSFFNGSVNSSSGTTATFSHFVGNSSSVGIAAGAGAGSSPTVSISGTDQSGLVTVVTGTSPTGNAIIATITYATTYPTTTYVSLTPANATAALLSGATMVYTNGGATTFTINSGTTGLTTGTYIWAYHVGGK